MIIFREKFIFWFTVISLIFFLVSIFLTAFNLSLEEKRPLFILHFDAYRGVDFLGKVIDVWFIISVVFLMLAINVVLIEIFFYRERILSYFLAGVNFLISALLVIVIGVIISIN